MNEFLSDTLLVYVIVTINAPVLNMPLCPAMSKVFEKNIYNQLYQYFDSNNLFYKSQYGFRKNHSTELAALELIDRIKCDLDKGNIPVAIFKTFLKDAILLLI